MYRNWGAIPPYIGCKTTFNEVQSRIRKGHSPDNLALLRRFAINIFSLDTSKESTRKKGKRAAWDENNILNCLAAIIQDAVALESSLELSATMALSSSPMTSRLSVANMV